MDKNEMERLMDKYKAEMLEFSRRNNMSGYPQANDAVLDEREEEMKDAIENDEPYERDRRDPLSESITVQQNESEATVPAVAQVRNETPAGGTDAAKNLRENCTGLNENSTPEQRAKCREINEFLRTNNESGSLKVQAYASDQAFGVGSARVMIFAALPGGNVALYDGLTDNDGISESVILPAPPRSLSQSPQTGDNPALPYAVYSVYVEHPSYVRAVFTNVPVFSGIESVQPVRMLAKSEGMQEPEPIVVDETSRSTVLR